MAKLQLLEAENESLRASATDFARPPNTPCPHCDPALPSTNLPLLQAPDAHPPTHRVASSYTHSTTPDTSHIVQHPLRHFHPSHPLPVALSRSAPLRGIPTAVAPMFAASGPVIHIASPVSSPRGASPVPLFMGGFQSAPPTPGVPGTATHTLYHNAVPYVELGRYPLGNPVYRVF